MPSPQAERGHEVRQRLLAAATELIGERGWTAVSTRVLAERAGVTPSVVHYHFPSLPRLLNEAALGLFERVLAGIDAVLESADTPGQAVDALLGSAEQYTGADRQSLAALEAYLAAGRDDDLRRRLGEAVAAFRRRLGDWLSGHGVAAPTETATVLIATVDGLLLHRGLDAGIDNHAAAAVLRRIVTA